MRERVNSVFERYWESLTSASIFSDRPPLLLDVRAETEFEFDHTPSSVNIPILNDQERHEVGLCFKNNGQAAAIALGHALVSGEKRAVRLTKWKDASQQGCQFITCWRGGLRSQIAAEWLRNDGVDLPRIERGTKQIRRRCLRELEAIESSEIAFVMHGRTGSGKTALLQEIQSDDLAFVDLEGCAKHRGSSFGAMLTEPQPQQATFENRLAIEWQYQQKGHKKILLEGEAKLIGKSVIPINLFEMMQTSAVVLLDTALEERIQNIFREYVQGALNRVGEQNLCKLYKERLQKISKKLGGVRYQEVLQVMEKAFDEKSDAAHKEWIEKLLVYYYDPLYTFAHDRLKDRIVFEGDRNQLLSFLYEASARARASS